MCVCVHVRMGASGTGGAGLCVSLCVSVCVNVCQCVCVSVCLFVGCLGVLGKGGEGVQGEGRERVGRFVGSLARSLVGKFVGSLVRWFVCLEGRKGERSDNFVSVTSVLFAELGLWKKLVNKCQCTTVHCCSFGDCLRQRRKTSMYSFCDMNLSRMNRNFCQMQTSQFGLHGATIHEVRNTFQMCLQLCQHLHHSVDDRQRKAPPI